MVGGTYLRFRGHTVESLLWLNEYHLVFVVLAREIFLFKWVSTRLLYLLAPLKFHKVSQNKSGLTMDPLEEKKLLAPYLISISYRCEQF